MHKAKVLELFSQLVSIPSVSADPSRKQAMRDSSELLAITLRKLGFEVKSIQDKKYPPLVCAYKIIGDHAETIGIYGHYDVQPEHPTDQWNSPPFKLTLRDGFFYGRGVADNKGHIVENIAVISKLIEENRLNKNVVFVIEGEEESNGVHFETLLTMCPRGILERVDVWFVTDMGARAFREPQIFNALRGIITGELTITTASKESHSGVFGNRVYNPAQILCDIVTKIRDANSGFIYIPGFYEDITPVSDKEYKSLVTIADTPEDLKKRSGAYILPESPTYPHLPPHMPLALTSKLAPSFDVNGIISGHTGAGPKTIIPAQANLKFSFRLVPGQKVKKVITLIESFVQQLAPQNVAPILVINEGSDPFYTDIDNPWMQRVSKSLGGFFHTDMIYNRSGGSVPAAEIFQRLYRKPVILTGFTLPGDNIHAPNENFHEEMFWLGIEALTHVYTQ